MSEAKEQLEKAKNIRRAAKGKLTRVIRTAKVLLGVERPVQEIEDAFKGNKGFICSFNSQT